MPAGRAADGPAKSAVTPATGQAATSTPADSAGGANAPATVEDTIRVTSPLYVYGIGTGAPGWCRPS